ncbi:hypothetical protein [Rhodopseudomonas palustris]|nr:hypothetical protein [Rhodopseudomonas palustris]
MLGRSVSLMRPIRQQRERRTSGEVIAAPIDISKLVPAESELIEPQIA